MRILLTLLGALMLASLTQAEPYFAVREGMDCSGCHINVTGGGLRNSFGNVYSQNQLPATPLSALANSNKSPWNGDVGERFAVGGNARYSARQFDIDGQDGNPEFAVDRVSLYLSMQVIDAVSLYIDQQVAPGGSISREAWGKWQLGEFYFKAGKFFLPFGWRLEDDTAFIRETTGINFNNADNGIEFGYNTSNVSAQFAVSNGTAGGIEVDDGKQTSLRLAYFQRNWQLGLSVNQNNTDLGERNIAGIFAGLNTGPVTWLAEWDRIDDQDFPTANGEQDLALLEANYLITRGHNLKFTYEMRSFDDNREDRHRYSAVWEYIPLPFTQLRAGYRERDSDDTSPALNSNEAFVQLHLYF